MNPAFAAVELTPDNPLLDDTEAAEKKKQEIVSAFLTGVLTGAACVGIFLGVRWMLNTGKTTEIVETVETAMEETAKTFV